MGHEKGRYLHHRRRSLQDMFKDIVHDGLPPKKEERTERSEQKLRLEESSCLLRL